MHHLKAEVDSECFIFKGSDSTGEFFNPAYDCLEVLNKNSEAKDGFYWIKLSGNEPKKVQLISICCSP